MVKRIISTVLAGFRDEEDDPSAAPIRRLIRISLPLIFNQGSVLVMMFVDRIFLSWYGINEIAAVWPAAILCWTTTTFFYSISGFINLFVAHYPDAVGCRFFQYQPSYLFFFSFSSCRLQMMWQQAFSLADQQAGLSYLK